MLGGDAGETTTRGEDWRRGGSRLYGGDGTPWLEARWHGELARADGLTGGLFALARAS